MAGSTGTARTGRGRAHRAAATPRQSRERRELATKGRDFGLPDFAHAPARMAGSTGTARSGKLAAPFDTLGIVFMLVQTFDDFKPPSDPVWKSPRGPYAWIWWETRTIIYSDGSRNRPDLRLLIPQPGGGYVDPLGNGYFDAERRLLGGHIVFGRAGQRLPLLGPGQFFGINNFNNTKSGRTLGILGVGGVDWTVERSGDKMCVRCLTSGTTGADGGDSPWCGRCWPFAKGFIK